MTKQEFQRKYHNYRTIDGAQAQVDADAVNTEGIDGHSAVAVELPPLGWCLMLDTAANALPCLGIPSDFAN
jgi:hypothetical protein